MITCNVIIPQLFWFKKMRTSIPVMFVISIIVNIGMWFERFVIIVTSLHRDFLPVELGLLPARPRRHLHLHRHLRAVPHAVPAVRPVPADDRDLRSEGRAGRAEARVHGEGASRRMMADAKKTPSDHSPTKDKLGRQFYGLVAEFDDRPEELVKSRPQGRARSATPSSSHTPFPVHGIDEAIGIPYSKLGWIVLCAGSGYRARAVRFSLVDGAIDYPLVIGGKPLFAVEFSVPVTFELTVLFSAFAAVFGMFALNGLPQYYHPVFNSRTTRG